MEPSQTTFIYSLWKLIDPPFQKPHRSPVQIPHMEPLQKHLQIHHRNLIHPLCRDLIETHYIEELQIPYRETFQKPIMDPSYGVLIVNLLFIFLQKPYTSMKPVRNSLQIPHMGLLSKVLQIPYRNFVDPLHRDRIETHEGSFILFLIENPDLRGCRPPNQVTDLYRCSMYYKITKLKVRNAWKFYP